MRYLPVVLALLPTFVFAEEIVLSGDVTDVILYPDGATVTRNIPFNAVAGQHDLVITGVAVDSLGENLRVSVHGAEMGIVTMREDYVPPRDAEESAAVIAARAAVEVAEDNIRAQQDRINATGLEKEAATARIAFLRQIGEGDKLANSDVALLRDVMVMVGEETLAARQEAHRVELAVRALRDDMENLHEDLETAEKQLAALVPDDAEQAYLSVSVSSDGAIDGMLQITGQTDAAAWVPAYEMRLGMRETPTLTVDRAALVAQYTGENWNGVNLVLSTLSPTERLAPSEIYPRRRRIEKPAPPAPAPMMRSMVEPMMEAMMIDEAPGMQFDSDGLSATYTYSEPVNMASHADMLRISLGTLETRAKVYAQAVPMNDATGFVIADFTNDTGALILATSEATFYRDGRYIGKYPIEEVISTGAKATLGFGPIEGMRLTRQVVDRNEGDGGFVSRVNEAVEVAEIGIENLTDRAWDVRLFDRVPFSEQEDLMISWRGKPAPSETDVDRKRGILRWDFTLAPDARKDISLSHRIEWPSGMELR